MSLVVPFRVVNAGNRILEPENCYQRSQVLSDINSNAGYHGYSVPVLSCDANDTYIGAAADFDGNKINHGGKYVGMQAIGYVDGARFLGYAVICWSTLSFWQQEEFGISNTSSTICLNIQMCARDWLGVFLVCNSEEMIGVYLFRAFD